MSGEIPALPPIAHTAHPSNTASTPPRLLTPVEQKTDNVASERFAKIAESDQTKQLKNPRPENFEAGKYFTSEDPEKYDAVSPRQEEFENEVVKVMKKDDSIAKSLASDGKLTIVFSKNGALFQNMDGKNIATIPMSDDEQLQIQKITRRRQKTLDTGFTTTLTITSKKSTAPQQPQPTQSPQKPLEPPRQQPQALIPPITPQTAVTMDDEEPLDTLSQDLLVGTRAILTAEKFLTDHPNMPQAEANQLKGYISKVTEAMDTKNADELKTHLDQFDQKARTFKFLPGQQMQTTTTRTPPPAVQAPMQSPIVVRRRYYALINSNKLLPQDKQSLNHAFAAFQNIGLQTDPTQKIAISSEIVSQLDAFEQKRLQQPPTQSANPPRGPHHQQLQIPITPPPAVQAPMQSPILAKPMTVAPRYHRLINSLKLSAEEKQSLDNAYLAFQKIGSEKEPHKQIAISTEILSKLQTLEDEICARTGKPLEVALTPSSDAIAKEAKQLHNDMAQIRLQYDKIQAHPLSPSPEAAKLKEHKDNLDKAYDAFSLERTRSTMILLKQQIGAFNQFVLSNTAKLLPQAQPQIQPQPQVEAQHPVSKELQEKALTEFREIKDKANPIHMRMTAPSTSHTFTANQKKEFLEQVKALTQSYDNFKRNPTEANLTTHLTQS